MRRKYLGRKIVRVQFHGTPVRIAMAGVTSLSHSDYEWKMQVDTTVTPVGQVTAAVLDAGAVADIAIEDPPLEEVIARIYGRGRKEESS